jgi:flagellar biosynthesis/type III secretory pathway protein FliH
MGLRERILDYKKQEGIEIGRAEGLEIGVERGVEIGIEQSKVDFIKNLLAANQFTVAQIANFASVTESFVRKVRTGLIKIKSNEHKRISF